MRSRRLICVLLGVWLGVSAMLAVQVYESFDAVAGVLKAPPDRAKDMIRELTPVKTSALLRYTAGLENIYTYETWEEIQIVLGILISATLALERHTRVLAVPTICMVIVVVFEHFKLTPDMAWLSSTIDFVPWTAESQTRDQFWNLHRMYMVLDAMKMLVGLAVTGILVVQQSGRRVRYKKLHDPLEDPLRLPAR
jgi:hypothetical protein